MSNFTQLQQQQQQQHLQPGGPAIPPVVPPAPAAGGGAFPGSTIQPAAGAVAEVVPLPGLPTNSTEGATTGGFMSKFQVHFPQTGNDNPARRITSGEHTDSQGWTWRLVLHPWGHDARGCYSAFLELSNAESLPPGFSRYVKLEFAMHAWDTAFHQVEPVKTQFLLHKFNAQATDFGYTRAFEHETIMAQRNIFIDPQGFVRISVKIIDVREAYFRVATDADLARSVTGRGGGGDFADWSTCLPAKSFKHDQLLYVIQKLSELTRVPLVSCRPWLCTPRDYGNGPTGPVRPVAALLPQHLQMTICEALGDRPQYHIYLEEVDTTPDVWSRRRATPGELPAKEAGQLLLAGRAYAQLPNEVFLVFLKIDRRIIAAHASRQQQLALGVHHPAPGAGNQPEFVFIGKAMAHRTDRGCELIPIARNLAHLPENLDFEVFEQIAAEEVRRFSGEKTVAEAHLSHGSVLLFRSAQSDAAAWPPRPAIQSQAQAKPAKVPVAAVSSVVPFNTAAAAAAAAAMSAHAAVTHAPKPHLPARKGIDAAVAAASAVVAGNPAPAPAKVAAASSAAAPAVIGSTPLAAASAAARAARAAAAAVTPVNPPSSSPSASPSSSPSSSSSSSSVLPTSPLLQLPPQQQQHAPPVASNGALAAKTENNGSAGGNAPGWDGSHMAAAEAAVAGAAAAAAAGNIPVVMNAEAQKRATYLALFQVQENARQHQVKEAARAAAKKLAAEAALAAAKEKHNQSMGAGAAVSASAAAATAASVGEKVVAAAKAAAVAAAAAMKAPPQPVLSPSEKAEVAQAARMAAQIAAAEHASKAAAAAATHHSYRTVSIKEALREGAPPPAPAVMRAATTADIAARQAAAAAAAARATAAAAVPQPPVAVPARPCSGGSGNVEAAARGVGSDGTRPGPPTAGVATAPSNNTAGAAAAAVESTAAVTLNSGPEEKIDVNGSTTSTEASGNTIADGNSSDEEDAHAGGDPTSPVLQTPENEDRKRNAPRSSGEVDGKDPAATKAENSNNNNNNNNNHEPIAAVTTARETSAVAIPRTTRAARAAAAVADTDEDGNSPDKSEPAAVATATAAATAPVEIQRRSSRKAAAVAAQQIQTSARAGTRGSGGSAAVQGGTDGTTRSPRAGCGGSEGGGGSDGGGGLKRRGDDGEGGAGPKKTAKTEKGEAEAASAPASSAPTDLSAFISQLMHVPGFTMEKCMELTRSKERAEIASAIKTISHDEKDSFRSRQLERLLAIKEKEAGSGDVGGGGGGGE